MGSSSGTCEIVEAKEESDFVRHNMRSSRSNYKMSGKDQALLAVKVGYKDFLKDDINKLFEAMDLKQSRSLDLSQLGKAPMRNNFKLPVTTGVTRSPGTEITETVNMKQALREFSLTKASEMAAMKRLSKLASTSRASEAGRITTLYNSVVIEASYSSPSFNDMKRNVVQKSMEIEEGTPKFKKNSDNVDVPSVQSSSKSLHSSPRLAGMVTQHGPEMTRERNVNVSVTRKVGTITQQEKRSSSPSCSISTVYIGEENESIHSSSKVVKEVSISKPLRKGRSQTATSSHLVKGNRVGKLSRNTTRAIKPVIRSKGISKKKMKEDTSAATCTSSNYNEVNGDADPNSRQLICERCQCAMSNASKESKDSLASLSNHVASATEVISNNGKSGVGKTVTTFDGYNSSKAAIVKVKKITRVTDKGEFSQSSKSSQGEYSSSTTSISEESNVSGSSCGNRPHMAKDARWEAMRQVRTEQGVLNLTHFNLLKKLGCGDIGTVYLAELIGANCLFAIKVMDNEFLARRKKMPRAQTEREILRMLDHPFLPTLYAQFTSDNLSCLVMEYCPGGDLHVLRQKQPGRIFPETAARFYVAEVLLALEYLHMLGVVYRDLKPENILVREDGHIMLTDFDLSLRCTVNPTLLKSSSFNGDPARVSGPCTESNCVEPFCIEPPCQVPCFSPRFLPASAKARKLKSELANQVRSLPQLIAEPTDARSNSFVGTHEYLAPEIIKGDGHGAAVDWWTFGVFLYELLYGRTPFKGCNNDETLANVVLQSLKFPDSPFVSFQARELIRGLLVKEPENRFGTEKGAAEIKKHPFFEGLNWALIRCAIPPELLEFCEFDIPNMVSQQNKGNKLLECKATGEHLEFELF